MWAFKQNIYKSERSGASVVSFYHSFSSDGSSSSATSCSLNVFDLALYSSESVLVDGTGTIVATDMVLYTDSGLTTPYNGGNLYYHYNSIEANGTAIRIASTGVMVLSVSCA